MFYKNLSIILLLLAVTACGARVPRVDVTNLSKEDLATAYNVKIYEFGGQYNAPKYTEALGNVSGYSCKHLLTDSPASKGDALTQLRINASKLDAVAVIDVMFDHSGADALGTNCWQSIEASGMAVK